MNGLLRKKIDISFLKKINTRFGDSALWQFVKFNLVSFSITLLQLALANLLPLIFDGETQTFKVDTYAEIQKMAKKPPKEEPEFKQLEFVDLTPEEAGELPWPERGEASKK